MRLDSRQELFLQLIKRAPTAAVSRFMGRLARVPVPGRVRSALWKGVATTLGANLDGVEKALDELQSFDAFFTRALRDGHRPIAKGERALVLPSDGIVSHVGTSQSRVPVKGDSARLCSWLGVDMLPWKSARWCVVYLSPKDYHRVHSPVSGTVSRLSYHPGRLLPVNPALTGPSEDVFSGNERVVIWLDSPSGPVAVCMVGALCVGGISLSHFPLRTNALRDRCHANYTLPEPIAINAGDELGVFHIGSSVVLAWEGSGFDSRDFVPSVPIHYGQLIGNFPNG